MTTPKPLTPEQTISFLLSVIASGERLTDAEVEAAREAARATPTPTPAEPVRLDPMCRGNTPDGPCDDEMCEGHDRPAEARLREALEIISEGRHPDGHRGAVLVARAALARLREDRS